MLYNSKWLLELTHVELERVRLHFYSKRIIYVDIIVFSYPKISFRGLLGQ